MPLLTLCNLLITWDSLSCFNIFSSAPSSIISSTLNQDSNKVRESNTSGKIKCNIDHNSAKLFWSGVPVRIILLLETNVFKALKISKQISMNFKVH